MLVSSELLRNLRTNVRRVVQKLQGFQSTTSKKTKVKGLQAGLPHEEGLPRDTTHDREPV